MKARTEDSWVVEPPGNDEIQRDWDTMILGWARAQREAFTILDVMRRLYGPGWVPQTVEHYRISAALHRMPRDEFAFSAPLLEPGGVCTPTWTPMRAGLLPS